MEKEIKDYERAYKNLCEAVRKAYPLGVIVRVGKNPSDATVVGYSEESPEHVHVKFENGNVWEKHVSFLNNTQ